MVQTLIEMVAPQIASGIFALACLGVAGASLWSACNRTRPCAPYRRYLVLGGAFAAAAGIAHLLALFSAWFPLATGIAGLVNVTMGTAALIAAIALWTQSTPLAAGLAAALAAANQSLAECAQELAEVKHRFEMALAGSNISMTQQDRDLFYTWSRTPLAGTPSGAMTDAYPEDSLSSIVPHPMLAAKRQVLETGISTRMEVVQHDAEKTLWFDARVEPIYSDGAIVGVTTVAIDVTSHKLYEQHLQNLLRELSHRSKNLLAIVQGIARQTGTSSQTLPEYLARFSARLQALSGAHDLLINRAWHGADLRELIMREIGQDPATLESRLSITGEVTIVDPEAAQNIAMGLHEMASNAYRYGALQSPQGRVAIAWQRIEIDGRQMVELTWIESNGPSVEPPAHGGFGRALLERLVAQALEGTSELIFAPEGVRWILRFPVNRLGDLE